LPRRSLATFLVSVVVLFVLAAPAAAQRFTPGAPGAGDPFFPEAGNGGYDVRHYSLKLDYDQPANRLEGRTHVFARATQNLSRFNLDLRDFLTVSRVRVNGRRASFTHSGQELSITPREGLKRKHRFVVTVRYGGVPQPVVDPDESIEGWIVPEADPDGAFVVNEPQGSPGWYPVNDTPRDKATFDFRVTVPEGSTVMANGRLLGQRTRAGRTTWRWYEDSPMAPYLATATNGPFETRFYEANGLPMYDAVDPDTRQPTSADPNPDPDPDVAWERLALQPEIIGFFSELYGEYPFSTGGGIMDWAPNVFYSLESQGRANYWRVVGESTVVHEIAHQWFGNAVTLAYWPDIWLNEGFATWSEWIYDERHGGPTAQETFEEIYATPEEGEAGEDLWFPAPAALPGPEAMFHTPVYDRGAMTLQALRQKVGDRDFFRILRRWYRDNRYGNVTTADFIALSERVSRQQLDAFFDVWLYQEGKPASW
jgi:aminopeptidase N